MNDFTIKVLWAYIILLLVGGLIGFLKAKSKVSLITSAVFAALLILTTLRSVFQPGLRVGAGERDAGRAAGGVRGAAGQD